jgi:hypothetical protein
VSVIFALEHQGRDAEEIAYSEGVMLQRYKLRLGDGTILGVDHQGLHTWALDGKAMVQAAESHQWYPLREFLAAEYVEARRAARQRASSRDALPTVPPRPLPLVYPTPRRDKARPQSALEPSEFPPFSAESSETPVLAEVQPIPSEPPVVPVQVEPPVVHALAEDPAQEPVLTAEPLPLEVPAEEVADAGILAEELAPFDGSIEQAWIPDDDPTLALPADDRDEVSASDAPFSTEVEPVFTDALRSVQALVDEPAVPSHDADAQLSMLLEEDFPPIVPESAALEVQAAGPRPSLPLDDDLAIGPPGAPEDEKEASRPGGDPPIIPLKPLENEAPSAPGVATYEEGVEIEEDPRRGEFAGALGRWLTRGISAYDALLTGWIDRLAGRRGSIPPESQAPHAPDLGGNILLAPSPLVGAPPRSIEDDLLPPEPLKPPPPIRDLPVLRLADVPEPQDKGDVYGRQARLDAVWRWGTRILATGALLGSGIFAALNWESWAPKAGNLGRAAFMSIERIKESRDRTERQRQALQEAAELMPHLAPETLRLVIAANPTGNFDPPEIFRLASDAADRGALTLSSSDLQDLKELRGELLQGLRPSERERVREYDAARARRLVFPFEGRDVLELFGRGAYALPEERRERLQELYAKAVAAGLAASPEAAPGSTTAP